MVQNKIYRNFIKEILTSFFIILFGLTAVAWTVRAVNFLDLIVESGYSISTYFYYSFLNIFGILTKFIPLSLMLALIIFIIKQLEENEFVILWTSGVKKIILTNLFFLVSIFVLIFYIFCSTFLTPLALNKSRSLLSQENFNSFLPTIRIQQFSDSFKGFTFLVEQKIDNKIKNVFIYDSSNTLKNLTTKTEDKKSTIITSKEGLVGEKKMILFDGQIITTKEDNITNELVKFSQLNIDLKNLQTDTIIIPKLQETSSINLIKCILGHTKENIINCKEDTKTEIKTIVNRRFVLPFYILIIPLLCSFLLLKINKKKRILLNKYSIFTICFFILLYAEIIIRYTGISKVMSILFFVTPIIIIPITYFLLIFNFSRESYLK